MSLIKNIKKNYFFYFVFFFTILGIYFSLQTGITHDEQYDLYVWQANKNIILNTFLSKDFDTSFLIGGSKFYGSGFHLLSMPIEYFVQKFSFILNFDTETNTLLSKHASVFIFFILSSFFLRKILLLITKSNLCANIGTIFYLLYPYLLGHSFFNVKDIPFLSVWLICTYLIIYISKVFLEKKIIKIKHLLILSFLTAYLFSIRISGVLILIQYLVFFLVTFQLSKINEIKFIKKFKKEFLLSIILFTFFFILIQPNYWNSPLQFADAIKFMSQHLQTVCTLTMGECMKAQDLPASYIPIWLFFKLPIIILFGFTLYPFIEKKFKKDSFYLITINSLIISFVLIITLLIIFEVNLYDELRQIMFLLPVMIIVSLSLIFNLSKKFFIISITSFIIFFAIQNIKIYPYNYIWINNFSHISKISGVFELDYWGVGSRMIAEKIYKDSKEIDNCVVSIRPNGIKPFVRENQCLLKFDNLHNKLERPFYVSLTERSLNKGVPNNCNLIFAEKRKINFSNEELILAKLYKCE